MKTPRIPAGAQIVTTFAELRQLAGAFFAGHLGLLVLVGEPGLSKTSTFAAAASADVHLLGGWITPLQAYIESFEHRHKRLIFDDAESLWNKPAGRHLLRSLCDTQVSKTVRWTSTAPALNARGVPASFATTSTVALIVNRFSFGRDDETRAILDRAHLVYFDPTPEEVHRQAATWFWCQETFDYIGHNLHRVRGLSGRTYFRCWEWRQAGGDWKGLLERTCFYGEVTAAIQALEQQADLSVEERARRFIAQTGRSRSTYFAARAELQRKGQLLPPDLKDLGALRVLGTPVQRPSVQEALAADAGAAGDAGEARAADQHIHSGAGEASVTKAALIVPDDDPIAWAKQRLALAFRRGDARLVQQLQAFLRKLKET